MWEYKAPGAAVQRKPPLSYALFYKRLHLHVTAHPQLEHHVTDRWTGSEIQPQMLLKGIVRAWWAVYSCLVSSLSVSNCTLGHSEHREAHVVWEREGRLT